MKTYNLQPTKIRSQLVRHIRLAGITRLTLSSLVRRSRLVSYLVISKCYTLVKINQAYYSLGMKQQFNPQTEKAKLIALLMSEDVRS